MHVPVKKNVVLAVILGIALALAVPAFAATSLSVSFSATSSSFGDTLLVSAAALYFGLDTNLALRYRSDIGSATSAISLFYLSGESRIAPETIIIDRQKGRGWGALAKGKMPPGLVGKVKGGDPFSYNDLDFEHGVTIRFLASYYAVPEDTLIIWVRRGINVSDLAVCLNLAARAKVKPTTVVEFKLKGMSFTQLSAKYKVSTTLMKQPVAPKAKYGKAVPVKNAAASKNKGKGK